MIKACLKNILVEATNTEIKKEKTNDLGLYLGEKTVEYIISNKVISVLEKVSTKHNINEGDIIFYDSLRCAKFEIEGKKYHSVPKKEILAIMPQEK